MERKVFSVIGTCDTRKVNKFSFNNFLFNFEIEGAIDAC